MVWTYYITDRKTCPVPLLENIRRAVEAGMDYIQIREKDLPARNLLVLAQQAARLAQGAPTRILINDRLDIALAADLHGVHLAQSSLEPVAIRRQFPSTNLSIGVSTHCLKEIQQVHEQAVDFVTFGPVFSTPSKTAYGAPVGLDALHLAVQSSRIPVLALGGINSGNFIECLACGVAGIAAIRLFQSPDCSLRDIVRRIKGL